MRARVMLAGAVAMGLAGGAASAQPSGQPRFPPSLEREPMLAWLQRETDILPDRVVAVTPQALTSIVSTFPAGGGQGPRVVIRAEALSAETYARTGALSWHVSMTADCQGHRVRLGDTTGYSERNLIGDRRLLRAAETEWRAPEPGTALDNAWRAACDTSFKGPFEAPSVKVTRADVPPPATAAPAAPPPAVAAPPPKVSSPPPKASSPQPKASPAPRKPTPVAPPPVATAAPAAAPASGPAAGHTGGTSVQVGSYPDRAAATAALAKLAGGQAHTLEAATVSGRTWYRAVVSGFASGEAAGRYCEALKAKGGVCFVRR